MIGADFDYSSHYRGTRPFSIRIRKLLARKLEKIFVFLLMTSAVFSVLVELTYCGINPLPPVLIEYGVFISNLVLASNILVLDRILLEADDLWVKIFVYVLAIALFVDGTLFAVSARYRTNQRIAH